MFQIASHCRQIPRVKLYPRHNSLTNSAFLTDRPLIFSAVTLHNLLTWDINGKTIIQATISPAACYIFCGFLIQPGSDHMNDFSSFSMDKKSVVKNFPIFLPIHVMERFVEIMVVNVGENNISQNQIQLNTNLFQPKNYYNTELQHLNNKYFHTD